MNKQLILTDDSFIEAFSNIDITDYLEEIKAKFGATPLSAFQDVLTDSYLNDDGVSVEHLYNEFFPTFLSCMEEGFKSVANFLYDENYKDYFEFLSEVAQSLFEDTAEYIANDLEKVAELAKAFNEICFAASSSDFVAIAEKDFEDYIREYALELGLVSSSMESYVNWESYANDVRIDYKATSISAEKTLNYSGGVLIRA